MTVNNNIIENKTPNINDQQYNQRPTTGPKPKEITRTEAGENIGSGSRQTKQLLRIVVVAALLPLPLFL